MLTTIWNNIVFLLFLLAFVIALVGNNREPRRFWVIITAVPAVLAILISLSRKLF